jgi:hypothetical protein
MDEVKQLPQDQQRKSSGDAEREFYDAEKLLQSTINDAFVIAGCPKPLSHIGK